MLSALTIAPVGTQTLFRQECRCLGFGYLPNNRGFNELIWCIGNSRACKMYPNHK